MAGSREPRAIGRPASHAALIFLACCFFAACGASRPETAQKTVRVMTWNIHHGEGTDGTVDIDRIAKLIVDERIDVVALQEVDRGIPRSKKIDIITALADKTDRTYAFGKTIDYQGGEYGNGFLTRFPILEERNILLKETLGREQRAVLLLVLEIQGEEVVVANTHLDSRKDDSARIAAVRELKPILAGYAPKPALLLGDMNSQPGSRTIGDLSELMADVWPLAGKGDGFTFPSTSPEGRIDYVFTLKRQTRDSLSTRAQFLPVTARVAKSVASDHLPLIVEFTFTTEH
jgi:endonuclease/exonuclease/phosphatase family metal-dependent hydrolase